MFYISKSGSYQLVEYCLCERYVLWMCERSCGCIIVVKSKLIHVSLLINETYIPKDRQIEFKSRKLSR